MRPILERVLAITIDDLLRAGHLSPGRATGGVLHLAPGVGIAYESEMVNPCRSWIRLHPSAGVPQLIRVVGMGQTLGGTQYFFDLGRRVRRLYLAPDGSHFGSRKGLGLSYLVHHLSTKRRRELRAERIRASMGGVGWLLERPRGVSTRRWNFLRRRYGEVTGYALPEPWERSEKKLPRGRWDMPRDRRGRWMSAERAAARIAGRLENVEGELRRIGR